MALNAYDVQVCVWKMLKLSSKTCVTASINHPYVSSSLLLLFLLYICFPLVFWILIYSLPLVVCTCIALSISFTIRNGRKYREDGDQGEINGGNYSKNTKFAAEDDCGDDDKSKKPYARVHSVRRRRAKEIMREDDGQHNVEEKNAVSSTNFNCDMVDKNALIEETSPKEIREVEVDFSLVNNNAAKDTSSSPSQSLKHQNNDEEANKAMQGNEDDQKNVMDVGILDAERNKRLESLIARRRSRKLLSLQVRRSLMNMDRNKHSGGHISSLIIPKINTSYSPSKIGGLFSPGPGSAPSVLIPMRNPFDLPYDPQEEKPDLTGDSFQQEFTSCNNRDMVFCRHESFTLGPSFQNRDEMSSVHDFGFRQRRPSKGYRFSKPGNESDREFAPIMEQQSYGMSESKSNINSPDDDQIKEIIQVYDENGTQNHSEESAGEDESRQIPQSDFNSSSSSPSSSSSEEDQQIFKIDREAILKSLSSMRRNALQEIENNERIGDNLSYANSALENASSLKQQYYADKPMRRHAVSYSIASDMQVEVSEISSPPLTIDENMSYQDEDVSTYDGEMERNISWDGEDMWAGSSRLSEADDSDSRSVQVNEANEEDMIDVGVSRIEKPENEQSLSNSLEEQPLNEKHCIQLCASNAELSDNGVKEYATVESNSVDSEENHVDIEPAQHVEEEQGLGEASISEGAVESNDQQEQSLMPNVGVGNVQSSMISPKSVLLPTLSLSSFDPDIDEEVHQSETHTAEVSSSVALQNPVALVEQSRGLRCSDGDAQASQESFEPTNASTIEVNDTESVCEELKIQENDEQPKEVASCSSEILGIHEAPDQPKEEPSSRSFTNTDEEFSKDFETANRNAFSENTDHSENLISSLSTEEELSKQQEMVDGESTHNDSTKTSGYEDEKENSALHEETGHDERQTNSTTSICFDGTKDDQVQDFVADETPVALSELVRDNENSKSCEKNEGDRRDEQYANSHEAMQETISAIDNETK